MPLNFDEVLEKSGQKISNAPVVNNVVKNPFYTAILICSIIVLVIIYVFRNVEFVNPDGTKYNSNHYSTLVRLAVRTGLYSLLLVTAIQFLQNKNVLNEVNGRGESDTLNDMFQHSNNGKNIPSNLKPLSHSTDNDISNTPTPTPTPTPTSNDTPNDTSHDDTSYDDNSNNKKIDGGNANGLKSGELFVPSGVDVSFL